MLASAVSKAAIASFVSFSSSRFSFSNRAISSSSAFNVRSETFFSGNSPISALNFSLRTSDFPSSLNAFTSDFNLFTSSSVSMNFFSKRANSFSYVAPSLSAARSACFNFRTTSCSYFAISRSKIFRRSRTTSSLSSLPIAFPKLTNAFAIKPTGTSFPGTPDAWPIFT